MTANGPDDEACRIRQLEQLRLRTRQLESKRIIASPAMNHAWLVALDVELCRVEAATRMLAPCGPPEVSARHEEAIDARLVADPRLGPW